MWKQRFRCHSASTCLATEQILLGSFVNAPSFPHPHDLLSEHVSSDVYMLMSPGFRTLEKTSTLCLSWFSASLSVLVSHLSCLFPRLVDGTLVHPGDQVILLTLTHQREISAFHKGSLRSSQVSLTPVTAILAQDFKLCLSFHHSPESNRFVCCSLF